MNRRLHDLITWLPSRRHTDLNGHWPSIIDVYDVGVRGPFGPHDEDADDPKAIGSPMLGFARDRGRHSPGPRAEYDFDDSPTLEVPGDWNTQYERFHYYEGSMWYRQQFATPAADRVFLYVGAANHTTTVFLNQRRLAEHEGGYGPFVVELTDRLDTDQNTLVMRVNNTRSQTKIPTTRTDWFNYGGLIRDVRLLHMPSTFIRDAVVQLDPQDPSTVVAQVWVDGPDAAETATIHINDDRLGEVPVSAGYGEARLAAPDSLSLWSPENPALHQVTITIDGDEVSDCIGFRTITTDGTQILLNGEPVFLAGISLHDEALVADNDTEGQTETGRIRSSDEARALLRHAKDLGCNFVRLAHYQHNEFTVRACDELGLLAWCELPVYWGIQWDNADTLTNARSQLRELITRDRNRAAVALWSVANETPPDDDRTQFLRTLVADARELDPTRLLTAALFAHPADGDFVAAFRSGEGTEWVIDDPLGADLDVLGVNQYHGWYYGNFSAMATLNWSTPYNKPLIMTEFGGDARFGLRGDADESWTEDLQAEIYRHQFEMLSRISFLAGTSPWILKDFRAPFRLLPGVQDGFNRKGLIDPSGHRKLAFGVVQDWNRRHTTSQQGLLAAGEC